MATSANIKWSTPTTIQTLLSSELINLANNAQTLSNITVDNETSRNTYVSVEVVAQFGVNPTGYITVYWLTSLDGVNFVNGDVSTAPPGTSLLGNFPLRLTTSQQRIQIDSLPIPPLKGRMLVENKSGQIILTGTVKARFFNQEVSG